MNAHLEHIKDLILASDALSEEEREAIHQKLKQFDKELTITEFKLDRTEKVKRTTAILLEETIEELEQKRKAVEEQNRELEIEAAVERIRAQATAMQESTDLLDIVVTMRNEFVSLGHEAHYFWHMRWLPELYEKAMTSGDGTRIGMVMTLPGHIHGDISLLADWEKSDEPTVVFAMDVDTAVEYVDKMITLGDFEKIDPQAPTLEDIRAIGGLTFVMARTTHGEIGYSLPGVVKNPPAEDLEILKRFAGAFDLAHRRFLDLQKAEAQARESIKQASLDRVRAQIASMRRGEDLQQITPLIWDELKNLNIPFIRCGVFIMDEENEVIHTYLSTPKGESIAVLHLPFKGVSLAENVLASWRNQMIYREHWDEKDFKEWTNNLIKQGFIQSKEKYKAGSNPEILDLHFIPFKQGMLYIGNIEPLSAESLDLGHSLADAFSTAYDRYEDFIKLEEAKNKIEIALSDLEAAQEQLVQQEKLASLGQLTAGIAHEIKNPLNFVNNFSEVSVELIEEVREELSVVSSQLSAVSATKAGDVQDQGKTSDITYTLEILSDIEANLRKIHEHGSRADSIVKSMLQHSRGGNGQMEPEDMNGLIKEYVNLAFHGMRASKTPFNVDIELDLDESVGKVPLVAEDFSRVILNLCNNAFDAMRDKLSAVSSQQSAYRPKLIVRALRENKNVIIEIEDNGPGIPEEIKDKILQPFFTTKKGTQGTGLGLSITNDIIKAHGGRMEVKSVPESGSLFKITM